MSRRETGALFMLGLAWMTGVCGLDMRFINGEKVLALIEASKGALVLVAGFDLVSHRHFGTRHAILQLVRNFNLNPASSHPRIFALASHYSNTHLWTLAILAAAYALLRFPRLTGSGARAAGASGSPSSARPSMCRLRFTASTAGPTGRCWFCSR